MRNLLTAKMAQNIIAEVQKVLPSNIYITDAFGRTIASNMTAGIGKLHLGAIAALENKGIARTWNSINEQCPGISIAILYIDDIIGTLCIDGNVHEIEPFIMLLKSSIEMLVSQKATLDMQQKLSQMKEQYLRECLFSSEVYNREFIEYGQYLGIDMQVSRVVGVLYCPQHLIMDNLIRHLDDIVTANEGVLELSNNKIVLILLEGSRLKFKIQRILAINPDLHLAQSRPSVNIYTAYHEAKKALEIGLVFFPEKSVYYFENIQLIDILAQNQYKDEMIALIGTLALQGKGANLLDTLVAYLQLSGDTQKVSEHLHIHRNSLPYRLKRIYEITGKDPTIYIDLLYLFTAYICYFFYRSEES